MMRTSFVHTFESGTAPGIFGSCVKFFCFFLWALGLIVLDKNRSNSQGKKEKWCTKQNQDKS